MKGGSGTVDGKHNVEGLKSLHKDSVWYWADLETPNNDHYHEVQFYGHKLTGPQVGQANMATSSNFEVHSGSFSLAALEARMGQDEIHVSTLNEGYESKQIELALSQNDPWKELNPAFKSFMPPQSLEIRVSDPGQPQTKVSPNQNSILNPEEQQETTTEQLWLMIAGPEAPALHEKSVLVANSLQHPHPADNHQPGNHAIMELERIRDNVSNNQHFQKFLEDMLVPGQRWQQDVSELRDIVALKLLHHQNLSMRIGQAAYKELLEETMRRSFEQVSKNSAYPSVVGGKLPVGMNLKAKDKATTLGGNSS